MKIKTILYLRTDLMTQKIVAGGSVAHTLGVVRGFLRQEKEVVCATSCMANEIATVGPTDLKRLTISRILYRLLRWRGSCFWSNFSYFLQILPFIKRYQIDIIYQRYSMLNCLGLLLKYWKGVPFVLEYNGSVCWIDRNWGGRKWLRFSWLIKFIEKFNIFYSDKIIVVSEVLKEDLMSRGVSEKKILVNPNGVDVITFDSVRLASVRDKKRQELGISDKFVFCFIGTFSLWHGINILAEMIPTVVANSTAAHFLLIGDGPLRIGLEDTLKSAGVTEKQVTCTGMVAQDKGKEYLAAADVFLSPTQPNPDGSRFFGSPTKIFEYMSMAKPIIASDIEQVASILQPAYYVKDVGKKNMDLKKTYGILVAPKDINGFIQAACLVQKADAIMREQLGKNVRTAVKARYTWNHHVKKILSFVESSI
jgi:glycosyltransferase involved in cell wall biosynthesis